MRSKPIVNRNRAFRQKLEDGRVVTVRANTLTILTDELPVGQLQYQESSNTYLCGCDKKVLAKVIEAQGSP